jgi:hypothetical protein
MAAQWITVSASAQPPMEVIDSSTTEEATLASTYIARIIDDETMINVLANDPEIEVEKITRTIVRSLFNLSSVGRVPITLGTAVLDKAVGTYEAEDGSSAEIARDEDKLILRRPMEYTLLPISEAVYYVRRDNEFEVHFADEHNGVFDTLTLHIPLYHAVKATRKQI